MISGRRGAFTRVFSCVTGSSSAMRQVISWMRSWDALLEICAVSLSYVLPLRRKKVLIWYCQGLRSYVGCFSKGLHKIELTNFTFTYIAFQFGTHFNWTHSVGHYSLIH